MKYLTKAAWWTVGVLLAMPQVVSAACDPAISCCAPSPPGGGGPTCGSAQGVASTPSNSSVNVGAGNPINVITGNKYQVETDMPALPGVLGLEIVRHYNSAYSQPGMVSGPLGRGWRLSYETELSESEGTVTLTQADRRVITFNAMGGRGSALRSADPSQGTITRELAGSEQVYVWTWTAGADPGRQLRFDPKGRLVQIKASTGEVLEIRRDSAGRLAKVIDPQGRMLEIHSLKGDEAGAGNRFLGIQAIDSPLGRYTYEHGSSLPPGSKINPGQLIAVLTAVTLPDKVKRIYHHEDPRHPTLLTGISVSAPPEKAGAAPQIQRISTWGYDALGRANLSVKGEPARMAAGADGKPLQPPQQVPGTGIEQVTLRWPDSEAKDAPQDVRIGKTDPKSAGIKRTILTNSLGQETVYSHTVIAGEPRLLEIRGPGCATCAEPNVRYSYDKLGRVISTTKLDAQGRPLHATLRELDDQGRALEEAAVRYVGGKPQRAEWRTRYTYDEQTRSVTIRWPSVIDGREHAQRIERNAIGQTVKITETGFSPINERREVALQGVSITRSTAYKYETINGRSVLVEVDGPLPNGPKNSPEDSDITVLRYDPRADRVTEIIYPLGLKAELEFDAAGRLASYRPADGVLVHIGLDYQGRMVRWQRAGLIMQIDRDVLGRPVTLRGNEGRKTFMEYDSAGRLQALVNGQGMRREVARDSEGNVLKAFWKDAAGDVPFEPIQFEYDHLGRPVADEQGNRMRYDEQGRLAAATDVLNRERRFDYDPAGRLAAVIQRAMVPSAAGLLNAGGGSVGHVASVTTGFHYYGTQPDLRAVVAGNGARTDYQTDDFGRTVRIASPDTGVRRMRYNHADRIVESADATGAITQWEYDALGRVIARRVRSEKETELAQWRYQGPHLMEHGNAQQWTLYRRDAEGRVVEQEVRLTRSESQKAAFTYMTRFRYDDFGRVREKVLSDGIAVVQEYDSSGRPSKLYLRYPNGREQAIVESLQGTPAHGLQELVFGNGVAAAHGHDRQGRLSTLAVKTRQPNASLHGLYAQRIGYDAVGRITAIDLNGDSQRYEYDGFDRLVEAQAAQSHRRYAYDAVGNRTAMWELPRTGLTQAMLAAPVATQGLLYGNGSNRLREVVPSRVHTVAAPPVAWLYGFNGSPLAAGARTYRHGASGRLVEVTSEGKTLARYGYNAGGERVFKISAQGTRYYLYADAKLVAEADEEGRLIAHYFYLGHTPIAKVETRGKVARLAPGWVETRPSMWQRWLSWVRMLAKQGGKERPDAAVASVRVLYIHSDHLGTPRLATDLRQEVVWRASYDAFGAAVVRAGPDSDGNVTELNLRFPGQYFDAETGTHYNYLRDYDPALGRYVQSDPIGLAGGVNTYAYVGGNPLLYSDPYGLYRLVLGFEVNNPAAFAGGVHDLNEDYGHAFFYLVDNSDRISTFFSFGPAEQMTLKGQLVGVNGKLDYAVQEASKLFSMDINALQYATIQGKVAKFRFDVLIGKQKYWTVLNDTCASAAMDVLGSWYLGLGLPAGKSKVSVPSHLAGTTDGLGLTLNGVTKFDVTNPYALYDQLVSRGSVYYNYTDELGVLVPGQLDPLKYSKY